MRLYCAHYVLQAKSRLSARAQTREREGALLMLETNEGVGFADIHPWPELGDLPLKEQLERLARGENTALTARSLAHAELDRRARSEGQSLFADLKVPRSHWLISDLESLSAAELERVRECGFRSLKIKVGANLVRERDALVRLRGLSEFALRFDFNETATFGDCLAWVKTLPSNLRERIEFLEDPIAWDATAWRELRASAGLNLARDRGVPGDTHSVREAFSWLVIKPATQDAMALALWAREQGLRIVLTSYLDHPVGQLGAAHFAALIAREHSDSDFLGDCGLVSHLSYETNEFSEALDVVNGCLQAPNGTGIGFDELLRRQNWRALT